MNDNAVPMILLGAGGHAKVVLDLLRACGREVMGVCDPALGARGATEWRGLRVLGGDEAVDALAPGSIALANGIGQRVGDSARRAAYERLRHNGHRFPPLVHPSAWVSDSARIADGVQVMAGAIVQADAAIGENTIVNTLASVDHDCRVGAHVHVAPRATLCGGAVVGDAAFLGAGCTVLPGIGVGAAAVLGAGTVLARDLEAGLTRFGPTRGQAATASHGENRS